MYIYIYIYIYIYESIYQVFYNNIWLSNEMDFRCIAESRDKLHHKVMCTEPS